MTVSGLLRMGLSGAGQAERCGNQCQFQLHDISFGSSLEATAGCKAACHFQERKGFHPCRSRALRNGMVSDPLSQIFVYIKTIANVIANR